MRDKENHKLRRVATSLILLNLIFDLNMAVANAYFMFGIVDVLCLVNSNICSNELIFKYFEYYFI